jgi:hypothetical protein
MGKGPLGTVFTYIKHPNKDQISMQLFVSKKALIVENVLHEFRKRNPFWMLLGTSSECS